MKETNMGVIKAVIADALLTSLWVISLPIRGISTFTISSYLGSEPKSLLGFFIGINVATLFVLTFSVVGALMGGASFNPTTTVSFYAAGLKPGASLFSLAVKLPAQAIGGVGGAMTLLKLMPHQYKRFLKGPSLKVDLHTGAFVEGVLGFVFSLSIILVMLKGPKNLVLQIYLVALTTVSLVIAGGKYTGPSLNPANAYGWAYVNNWHNSLELFYVYWIGPLIGGIFAALVYRIFFKAPVVKEKKA